MLVFILHAAFGCNCLQYLVASDNARGDLQTKGQIRKEEQNIIKQKKV